MDGLDEKNLREMKLKREAWTIEKLRERRRKSETQKLSTPQCEHGTIKVGKSKNHKMWQIAVTYDVSTP